MNDDTVTVGTADPSNTGRYKDTDNLAQHGKPLASSKRTALDCMHGYNILKAGPMQRNPGIYTRTDHKMDTKIPVFGPWAGLVTVLQGAAV